MDWLEDDRVYLLLQFLKERNYPNALHCLESESALFLDIPYCESLIKRGLWNELEEYLQGFFMAGDRYSEDIRFAIKKQKLYETFVNNEPQKALLILRKEMNGLEKFYDAAVMSDLFLTDNAREHAYFVDFVDIDRSRTRLCMMLGNIIQKHPSLSKKCRFPEFDPSRLSILCNQSLNWRHSRCLNPKSVKEFHTILTDHTDHTCGLQVPHKAIATSPGPYDRNAIPTEIVFRQTFDSPVTAFDFHPILEHIAAVGTKSGGFYIVSIAANSCMMVGPFKQWDRISYSLGYKCNTGAVSVSSIKWSPDGSLLGVGYSKHLVHVYEVKRGKPKELTEIEAHAGHVSGLAFLTVGSSSLLVTCGNEHIVKIWDARTGLIRHTLQAHQKTAVCSLSLRQRAKVQVIYAIDAIGMVVMAWELSNPSKMFTYDPQGCIVKKIAFNSDGSRMFISGHDPLKKPFLQEWTDKDNHMKHKRNYFGLGASSGCESSFDNCGRMLAAASGNSVIFWDVDQENPVCAITTPCKLSDPAILCFSENGVFLALAASDNTMIIYGNNEGARDARETQRLALALKASSSANSPKLIASTSAACGSVRIHDLSSPAVLEARSAAENQNDDAGVTFVHMEPTFVHMEPLLSMPSQIRSLKLSIDSSILRLVYACRGQFLLALTSKAANKLWRWEMRLDNITGMATTRLEPRELRSDKVLIYNDTATPEMDNRVACLAMSKDKMHALSASGGKVSVLNISTTMERMTSIIPPPPVATCLAYDPRSINIVCAGMADGSLLIYDIQAGEVLKKLSGHGKCVTGLAYFINGKVLASTGADDQLCLWDLDSWEKKSSKIIRLPPDKSKTSKSVATRVQSNPGETCLLVINGAYVATYDPFKLDCINKWEPPPSMGLITDAVYSCDGKWIYVLIQDGSVCVIAADKLSLECRINYTAYMPSNPSFPKACPAAIAANPSCPNQFSLGLSDGAVYVIEPLESENQWRYPPLPQAGNR